MDYLNQHTLWCEHVSLLWTEVSFMDDSAHVQYEINHQLITAVVDDILIKLIRGEEL